MLADIDQNCELSSVELGIRNTGLKVGSDPIFEVEVKNMCRCKVARLILGSEGFASSMPVDPNLFRREGNKYLINGGEAIPSSTSIKFRYSWDRAFKMTLITMQSLC